jgi:PKD repeat protein
VGGTGSTSQKIKISIPPPVAEYTFAPSSPAPGQSVQFTDVSGGNPTSWSWNFGDPGSGAANTSTLQNPMHVFANPGVYPVSLTAKNAGGTGIRNHAVTVAISPPVANFTFTPVTPSVNETVQFTDTSTGAPTGWSWTFGDPGAGASNTSSSPNPSHVFATAGVYTVKLVASNSGGSSTQTEPVTVSSFSTRSVSLPVAGHVTGVGGTIFLTDVLIQNPTGETEAATLFFYPVSGGSSSQTALSLAPLETRSLPDVVANEFGVMNSFGALRLDTVGSPPAKLRMTSRTYDRVGAGSFGMAISGVSADGTSTASEVANGAERAVSVPSRFVTGLQRNDQFRSNLGGVNDSASSETFAIVLRGTGGTILGTSQAFTLGPSGQWQVGIKDLFPSVTADALTAEFQSVGGSAVPVGYATLADNASGDLTYFPSLRPASAFLLPVASRVTGVGGALFASDLTLANVSDSPVTVTLTFWVHDKDNSSGAPQASLTLAPRETRLIADALNTLFGVSETFGALKIDSAGSLAVAERIWTASPTTAGTVGQQVDPMVLPDALYSRASILGLRQDSAFRSNAGFVNPNDSAATINLTLLRPNGVSIGTTAITVAPRGFTQSSLAGLFPGVTFPSGELLTISLDSGTTPICAYGIIADNVSQDLTASPALP